MIITVYKILVSQHYQNLQQKMSMPWVLCHCPWRLLGNYVQSFFSLQHKYITSSVKIQRALKKKSACKGFYAFTFNNSRKSFYMNIKTRFCLPIILRKNMIFLLSSYARTKSQQVNKNLVHVIMAVLWFYWTETNL